MYIRTVTGLGIPQWPLIIASTPSKENTTNRAGSTTIFFFF